MTDVRYKSKGAIEQACAEIVTRLRSTPVETARIRGVRRQFSRRIASWGARDVVKLAMMLIDQGTFIHRFVAYELVGCHREALASLDAKQVERFGRGLDSWQSVDTFALILAGQAWREQQIADAVVQRWARSRERWWRRTALVSTVPLNSRARGGRGDTGRTLKLCEILSADRDDIVVKALSWALRDLAKRDAKAVRRFLDDHQTELAARVIREVRNKLRTGLKNPRRSALH